MKSFSFDRVVALSALFIGIGTLILLVYEIRLTRKSQYAAVMPYLQIRNIEMYTPSYRIVLVNDGLGPAFVESIRVIDGRKNYNGDLQSYLQASGRNVDSIHYSFSNINRGRMIQSGAQIAMISSLGDEVNAVRISDIFFRDSLEIIVEYKSVFDERWTMSNRRGVLKVE